MRRFHLLEIEDQAWCPAAVRDGVTDYLRDSIRRMRLYEPVVPRLSEAIGRLGTNRIVDLCSGGGGPWPDLLQQLPAELRAALSVRLTDLYPNEAAADWLRHEGSSDIGYHAEPLDALDVPAELAGLRTLYSGFHHFDVADARAILQDCVDKNQAIAVFEATNRHPLVIAYMLV